MYYSLAIIVGAASWGMLFKTKESAEAARHQVRQQIDLIEIADDYGQEATIMGNPQRSVVLEDMDISKLGHCVRALHQQHVQIEAQKMAESDQKIRAARYQSGPAMLTPMGPTPNGGFRSS